MPPSVFAEPIRVDSYLPLRVQVYEALKEAITSGKLRPGERIIEDRICADLGVSRSPLREALRRLEGEGLVSILPRRGVTVTKLNPEDAIALFAVREVLEGLAASLASRHATARQLAGLESICDEMERQIQSGRMGRVVDLNSRFHDLMAVTSRNRWLQEFIATIRAQTRRFYRSSIEDPNRAPKSLSEHRQILQALKERDSIEAESLARLHVLRAREASAAGERTAAAAERP